MKPDVEVIFEFKEVRKGKVFNDYRRAHLVVDDFLTTGLYTYYHSLEDDMGEIRGITFIFPETYPVSI